MFNWPTGSRPRRNRSWYTFGASVVAAVATIGVLLVVVSHRDSGLPKAGDCPSSSLVNRVLGTKVAAPTAVSESDLLGCFYQEGADEEAVSVSFAVATSSDRPCRRRPAIEVSDDRACDVTGTPGTSRSGASLVVEAGELQDQFTSALPQTRLTRLEALAEKVLAEPAPPVHGGDAFPVPRVGWGRSSIAR